MTLIARLANHLTLDLSRNPVPAPAPVVARKIDTKAAHIALEKVQQATLAGLRAAVGVKA